MDLRGSPRARTQGRQYNKKDRGGDGSLHRCTPFASRGQRDTAGAAGGRERPAAFQRPRGWSHRRVLYHEAQGVSPMTLYLPRHAARTPCPACRPLSWSQRRKYTRSKARFDGSNRPRCAGVLSASPGLQADCQGLNLILHAVASYRYRGPLHRWSAVGAAMHIAAKGWFRQWWCGLLRGAMERVSGLGRAT